MTYNIRKTNGDLLVSIPDGGYNNSQSSLILFGKNFANWGTAINENQVHMLEHFANQSPPANPLVGQLWFNTIRKEMNVWHDNAWQLLNAESLRGIAESLVPNRLHVSMSGNDANSGLSWFAAKKTIKSACAEAAKLIANNQMTPEHVTILVASGDYTEQNPIVVPEGVSIVGDNLRSVTVRPINTTLNVFLLESQTYIYGITVRDHKLSPSALDITPTTPGLNANSSGRNLPRNTVQTGFAFAFNPGTLIRVSPYIQNCSSISGDPGTDSGIYPGGGGVLVDGDAIDPASRIHSIVVDAFTQINLGGIGVKVVGKGYMQLVSFFVNFCQFGLLCVDGGHVTALNSNCSFGNYSLWAEGFRYLDNANSVNEIWTGNGSTTQFATAANTFVDTDQLQDLEVIVNGTLQTLNFNYVVLPGGNNNSIISFNTASIPPANSTITAKIRFGSLIEASGYTMSYAGAGLSYDNLSASQGGNGKSDPNKYTISQSYGRIYHTTTDESGDFYVGVVTPGTVDPFTQIQGSAKPSFRIDQQRGTIDGRSFYQSIFGFMAPFVLALTRRNK